MVAKWEEDGGMGEKGEEIKEYLIINYKIVTGTLKYSTGNIVNNIVIVVCGVRWVLDLRG